LHITRKFWSPKFCGSCAPLNLKISPNILLKQLVSATPLKLLNRISWHLVGSKDPSFMKFCSVVSEELHWQAASEVYLGKFLSSKGHNSHKIQEIKISW
jgi:hypothetical protein